MKTVIVERIVWMKYPVNKPLCSGSYLILRRENVVPSIDIRAFTDFGDGFPSFEYDEDIDYWAFKPDGNRELEKNV